MIFIWYVSGMYLVFVGIYPVLCFWYFWYFPYKGNTRYQIPDNPIPERLKRSRVIVVLKFNLVVGPS